MSVFRTILLFMVCRYFSSFPCPIHSWMWPGVDFLLHSVRFQLVFNQVDKSKQLISSISIFAKYNINSDNNMLNFIQWFISLERILWKNSKHLTTFIVIRVISKWTFYLHANLLMSISWWHSFYFDCVANFCLKYS